jgi:hypothetical protein
MRRISHERLVDELTKMLADGWVLEGGSWLKNMAVGSPAGSTQKAVLAAPLQANSPALDSVLAFTGSLSTEMNGISANSGRPWASRSAFAGMAVARHQCDGAGAEQPHPVQLASAQEELAEPVAVGGRGHQMGRDGGQLYTGRSGDRWQPGTHCGATISDSRTPSGLRRINVSPAERR